MRVHRLTLALALMLAMSLPHAMADPAPSPPARVAKLPADPPDPTGALPPRAEADLPRAEGKQLAQLTPASAGDLSAAELIGLAYEYAWHEDYEAERAWLEVAVTRPASPDTARAMVLLAEARGHGGDTEAAQVLLDQVRSQYQDGEVLAFADLVRVLVGMKPGWRAHGRRFYSDAAGCQTLYAAAAQQWPGTYLGGWASLRLAAVYRNQLDRAQDAVTILEQIGTSYAGTPFSEYALEDAAAAVTFSLNRLGEGRQRYEQLLATTESSFVSLAPPHFGHSGCWEPCTNSSTCDSQSWHTYS